MRRYSPFFVGFVLLLAACGGGSPATVTQPTTSIATAPISSARPTTSGYGSRQCDAHIDRQRGNPPGDRDDHDTNCRGGDSGNGERHRRSITFGAAGYFWQSTLDSR